MVNTSTWFVLTFNGRAKRNATILYVSNQIQTLDYFLLLLLDSCYVHFNIGKNIKHYIINNIRIYMKKTVKFGMFFIMGSPLISCESNAEFTLAGNVLD